MTIKGSHLIIGIIQSGKLQPFAYSRGCEISESRDTIEYSSPTSGIWREHLPGRCSWSATVDCLLSDDARLTEQAFRDGTMLDVVCKGGEAGYAYKGKAIITQLRASGRIREMASYSISLKGCGELRYESL